VQTSYIFSGIIYYKEKTNWDFKCLTSHCHILLKLPLIYKWSLLSFLEKEKY
jgi:hypothetical protein